MAYWINKDTRKFLAADYLPKGQSVEERIREIANAAEKILRIEGYADKFESYMMKGWISLSSPVWSNFGNNRGLPISCNGTYFDDDTEDICMKAAEIGMQTKYGAGTSAYLGALRPRGASIKSSGGTSNGPVSFLPIVQAFVDSISQTQVRRGACAVYMDVEHPDIMEFLDCGEEGNVIQHLHYGVCISDAWMVSMLDGDKQKRKVWARILRKRMETGEPYVFWTDTVNTNKPEVYKVHGLRIHASNLCTEICQPSGEEESFACCVSSVNVLHFEDWRDSDLIETMMYFLDAVIEEYIQKTANSPLMCTAHTYAVRHRAVGLGILGWHSFLQSNMQAFESDFARQKNEEIWEHIDLKSRHATQKLAKMFGEPFYCKGFNIRNATRLAQAPTTSSSFILGQISPSIDPLPSNYYIKDLAKGKFTYKNPYLDKLLTDKGIENKSEIWDSILAHGGSVQHLDCLTDHEKDVFKTADEITQIEVIMQAHVRQRYIDQAQSLNLTIHPDAPLKDVSNLMIEAWRLKIKTLYYQRSTNPAQQLVRSLLNCVACEA